MNITNARYGDDQGQSILADFGGQQLCIPVDPMNRHYQEILISEVEIAPFVPE